MKCKKMIGIAFMAALAVTGLTACGGGDEDQQPQGNADAGQGQQTEAEFDASREITVVSREDGSGTRGAFIELFGIEEKDADGNKVDKTTLGANITNNTNNTSVMMTTVAGNEYAIGYISLGSLNDTVKAVKIDGAQATVDNIKSGTYKIARPFNIATKGALSEAAQDFINYMMSAKGQAVIEENGYIPVGSGAAGYSGNRPSGSISIAGSSSVTPVMEKLKEAYNAINPEVAIEIQQSDSTTGMTSVAEGICDIGMASREVKDSELEKGLQPTVIAMDGIAVIVNNDCPVEDMTSDLVKAIFTGASTTWTDVVAQ